MWQIRMRPWSEQIDELVQQGAYGDALALLDNVDQTVLPDKVSIHVSQPDMSASLLVTNTCIGATPDSHTSITRRLSF